MSQQFILVITNKPPTILIGHYKNTLAILIGPYKNVTAILIGHHKNISEILIGHHNSRCMYLGSHTKTEAIMPSIARPLFSVTL